MPKLARRALAHVGERLPQAVERHPRQVHPAAEPSDQCSVPYGRRWSRAQSRRIAGISCVAFDGVCTTVLYLGQADAVHRGHSRWLFRAIQVSTKSVTIAPARLTGSKAHRPTAVAVRVPRLTADAGKHVHDRLAVLLTRHGLWVVGALVGQQGTPLRHFTRLLISRRNSRRSAGATPSRFMVATTVGSNSISSSVGSPESQHIVSLPSAAVYLALTLQQCCAIGASP
jgi:hypothetical protein